VYETFQALYSQVEDIELSVNPDPGRIGTTVVTILLSSAPLVGNSSVEVLGKDQSINMVFDLRNEDVRRFLDSLRSRGLVSLNFLPNDLF